MRRGLLLWLAIGGAHARVRGAARRLDACDDSCCGERECATSSPPYGISVAIDGDTVVIGAWTRNYTQPEEAGVVFVGRIP